MLSLRRRSSRESIIDGVGVRRFHKTNYSSCTDVTSHSRSSSHLNMTGYSALCISTEESGIQQMQFSAVFLHWTVWNQNRMSMIAISDDSYLQQQTDTRTDRHLCYSNTSTCIGCNATALVKWTINDDPYSRLQCIFIAIDSNRAPWLHFSYFWWGGLWSLVSG